MRRLSEQVVLSVSVCLLLISLAIFFRVFNVNILIYLWMFTLSGLLFSLAYRATVNQHAVQAKRYLMMALIIFVLSVIMVFYASI